MKIRLKTFDEAKRTAIRLGFKADICIFSDEYCDNIYGIHHNWVGWGNVLEACYCGDYGSHHCYFAADCFVPSYCVKSIIDE